MTHTIDLNADLGEDESQEGIARDMAIMEIVSSCNIACGGHAGSSASMERMLGTARARGVAAGAHPSYPDPANFGRLSMKIDGKDLKKSLRLQVDDIKAAAEKTNASLHHIKPHGALYNDAQDDRTLAGLLVELAMSEKVPLVGMAGSAMEYLCKKKGVPYISEAFIDRRYDKNGRLVSRTAEGAVLSDETERIEQGLALATGQFVQTIKGESIVISSATLCLHSDSDGALETAKRMRRELERAGMTIAAPDL